MNVPDLYTVMNIDKGAGEEPPEVWQSPPLFRMNNDGRINVWLIGFSEEEELYSAWGTIDAYNEGRLQIAPHKVETNTSGRTVRQQSFQEANNQWERKQNLQGYRMNYADKSFFEKEAMLATKYSEKCIKEKDFPVYVQPKINGLRCRAHLSRDESKVELMSRGSEKINFKNTLRQQLKGFLQYMEEELGKLYPDVMNVVRLDGELFNNNIHFDEISGISRRKEEKSNNDELIDYYIFDVDFPFEMEYHDRCEFLQHCYDNYPLPEEMTKLYLVKSTPVYSHDEIIQYLTAFENEGFEGVMIRRAFGTNSYYKYGRSTALYKLKSFLDDDFVVVGGTCGKGKDNHCIIWILETNEGRQFNCRPAMTLEERKNIYFDFCQRPDNYIGRKYKVKYQELNKNGIPVFGTGLGFVDDR